MEFKRRTLSQLSDMICGNQVDNKPIPFCYRSSSYLTQFFADCDTDYMHDGSTRHSWVYDRLVEILQEPHPDLRTPPDTFCRLIRVLMDKSDPATDDDEKRTKALQHLNTALAREGFQAFYGEDQHCYLRHIGTNIVVQAPPNSHRHFTVLEQTKRVQLAAYLGKISEDELIGDVLLPLFRQLGFHRVTVAGHKDKALEYGKDLWMKYTLPTTHVLYFGILRWSRKTGQVVKLIPTGLEDGVWARSAASGTAPSSRRAWHCKRSEASKRWPRSAPGMGFT
jgi:hypothetical protein